MQGFYKASTGLTDKAAGADRRLKGAGGGSGRTTSTLTRKLISKLTSNLTGKGKGRNPIREKGKRGAAKREKGRAETPPQKSRKTRAHIQFPKP